MVSLFLGHKVISVLGFVADTTKHERHVFVYTSGKNRIVEGLIDVEENGGLPWGYKSAFVYDNASCGRSLGAFFINPHARLMYHL